MEQIKLLNRFFRNNYIICTDNLVPIWLIMGSLDEWKLNHSEGERMEKIIVESIDNKENFFWICEQKISYSDLKSKQDYKLIC